MGAETLPRAEASHAGIHKVQEGVWFTERRSKVIFEVTANGGKGGKRVEEGLRFPDSGRLAGTSARPLWRHEAECSSFSCRSPSGDVAGD